MSSKIIVQKFGGTSVSTPERREKVRHHVRSARDAGYSVVVVVSAMGRSGDPYATDTLLDLLRSDGHEVSKANYDMIYVCGEMISTAIMAHEMTADGLPAVGFNGAQAGIRTNGNHTEADVLGVDPPHLVAALGEGLIPIIGGSQGAYEETGAFTSLGRGGSDISGAVLGAALGAETVEIYTDVVGVARTDPRKAPEATTMAQISAASMLEMARFGAGVIHPRAVRAGRDGNVPLVVRATGSDEPGTLIGDVADENEIVGIASLGGMDGLIAPADTLDAGARRDWEQTRLIMSLVDDSTGRLHLAAGGEKAHELERAAAELGEAVIARAPGVAWVSAVGTPAAIEAFASTGATALAGAGIEIQSTETALTVEGGTARVTFVVGAADETPAVATLYALI